MKNSMVIDLGMLQHILVVTLILFFFFFFRSQTRRPILLKERKTTTKSYMLLGELYLHEWIQSRPETHYQPNFDLLTKKWATDCINVLHERNCKKENDQLTQKHH